MVAAISSGQMTLEVEALRVLVVDRHPVHHRRLLAGRALDRHHDGVVPVQEAPDHRDERDDRGDRHVAVERTGAVEVGQRGESDRRTTNSSRPIWLASSTTRGWGLTANRRGREVLHGLDQHHRVLAATDGDQQATRPGRTGSAAGWFGAGQRLDRQAEGDGKTVGHRELAEALVVEILVELSSAGSRPAAFDHHLRRSGRLVVAGPGGDVQVEQGALETGGRRRSVFGRAGLEGDGLDEGWSVVEGVPEGDGPRFAVECPIEHPEGADRTRIEPVRDAHVAHSVVARHRPRTMSNRALALGPVGCARRRSGSRRSTRSPTPLPSAGEGRPGSARSDPAASDSSIVEGHVPVGAEDGSLAGHVAPADGPASAPCPSAEASTGSTGSAKASAMRLDRLDATHIRAAQNRCGADTGSTGGPGPRPGPVPWRTAGAGGRHPCRRSVFRRWRGGPPGAACP